MADPALYMPGGSAKGIVVTARRVLLTGASGFVGRHAIVALLERGFEVHAAARRPAMTAAGVVPHLVDLLDPAAAARLIKAVRPSHLLHAAWYVTPGRYQSAPENLDWMAASLQLYRAFVAGGGHRILGTGTCAEYDWSYGMLDEATTPLRPVSLYGTAKHTLHQLLASAAVVDGVSLAWARLFFMYGPHEAPERLVPSVVCPLLRGETALMGAGTAERDFMHVADVARALAAVLDSTHEGPVNIASGSCRPIRDVVMEAAGQIGRPDLVRLGVRPKSLGEPRRLAASNAILRGLGFQQHFTLASGLADTIASYANQWAAVA